jgi:class 3 adenylate cyclase
MAQGEYTVLVVDDDASVCELLVDRLQIEGLNILTANNGRDGLRIIEEAQPDVIFMDLKMPEKDGLSVLRECQEKGIHEPVIIITAHATMNHAIEAMKLGAYDFVMKPFSLEQVVATCKQAFETLQLERQAALWQERATKYLHQMYPPEVAKSLVQGTLEAKHIECSVLFADIVASLNYETQHSPRRSAGVLTEYFTLMHEEVIKCGGWVNNFFGDGMMVVFGIPDGSPTHAFDAVNAAIRMGQALKVSTSPLRQKIGINTGTVLLGDVGSRQKPHYSVIGEVVSVAKRLTDMARPGEILIGSDTKHLAGSFRTESIGPVDVKGVGDREIYRVLQDDNRV